MRNIVFVIKGATPHGPQTMYAPAIVDGWCSFIYAAVAARKWAVAEGELQFGGFGYVQFDTIPADEYYAANRGSFGPSPRGHYWNREFEDESNRAATLSGF